MIQIRSKTLQIIARLLYNGSFLRKTGQMELTDNSVHG